MPETCAAIVIAAKHGELIKVRDYSGITNTVGALRCKFEFRTNDWDNATMTAVFCKGNMATNPEIVDGAIGVLLDSIDECAVPAEVLTRDAKYFSVGVWGVTTAGFRIVSKWLVFRIEDGCYVDTTEPIEPTPTVYEQIMSALSLKAPINHEHNDIYYTKSEIDNILVGEMPDIDLGGGSGLTDEQAADLAANTQARHTHNNKKVLDKINTETTAGTTRITYNDQTVAYRSDIPGYISTTEVSNKMRRPETVLDDLPQRHLGVGAFSEMVEILAELYAQKKDIYTQEEISKLDETSKMLLKERYENGLTQNEVSELLGYSQD